MTPPSDYVLRLPEGWFRVHLDPDRRRKSVNALVERQFAGTDDLPHLKKEARSELLARARKAYKNGGVELYLSLQKAGRLTVPASLLITLVPPQTAQGLPLDALAKHLAANGPLEQEISLEELPAGNSCRVRVRRALEEPEGEPQLGEPGELSSAPTTSVDHYIEIPGSRALLLLSFSTPLDPIADAMAELFDAVAHSLTWT
jgi:hypothetical protein